MVDGTGYRHSRRPTLSLHFAGGRRLAYNRCLAGPPSGTSRLCTRRNSARSVNAVMTATYWEIGPPHRRTGTARTKASPVWKSLAPPPGRGTDIALWKRLLRTQPAGHARVLPGLVNSADGVCGIDRTCAATGFTGKSAAGVCAIPRPRSAVCVSPSVVSLRPPSLGQQPTSPHILRNRSSARWLVRSVTRPPDRDAILRAHPAVANQGSSSSPGPAC